MNAPRSSRNENATLDAFASLFTQLGAKGGYHNYAVSTRGLTESFGLNVFQQEDIQELSRFVYQQLEEALEGTELANLIDSTFYGSNTISIVCQHQNCKHSAPMQDGFYDIPVSVENVKNLQQVLG